jgi:hypothetical protein
VRFSGTSEEDVAARKKKSVVIRHVSNDRIVALIEILSPGNKNSRHAIRALVEKAVSALRAGVHLLLIDLHPPGPRDPHGVHPLVWGEFNDDAFTLPPDKPLTLAAYSAGDVQRFFVDTVAVGDALPDMPLFLEPDHYVSVPLESTYRDVCGTVPLRWRRELEP